LKAFKIKIPGYKPFTMITETPESEIPKAVKEKFLVWPISVEQL